MKFHRPFLILCFLSVSCAYLFAQPLRSTYPVQTNVFLKPPHSLYLDDYCTSPAGKIVITLLNRDLLQPDSEVRLQIRINAGNQVLLATPPNKVLPTFRLSPGVPLQLSPSDLCPYLRMENLQASRTFSGRFPEGMLEVCVTAIEAHSGLQLSAATCSRAWITLNRPPLLNLPLNETRFPFREPQQFLFQWTPRHQGLTGVQYELVLKEIHDQGASPQAAFAYSQEVFSTTLTGTSFSYTALQPPLLENMTYAWQVRAVARDGFDELNVFENNGYSEIRSFSLAPACYPPTNPSWEQAGANAVIHWTPSRPDAVQVVAYHANNGIGNWLERTTRQNYINLFDLAPAREYTYKVGTRCSDGTTVYGQEQTLLLKDWLEDIKASCGKLPVLNLDRDSRLEELHVGDVFLTGDFPVTVTQMKSGGKSTFSGSGWIRIPMFMSTKVVVNFENITLNADRRLIGGKVESSYDVNEGQMADLDDLTHGKVGTGKTVTGDIFSNVKADFEIPEGSTFNYDPLTGKIVVTDPDGKPQGEITIPEKDKEILDNKEPFTYIIQDSKGNVHTLTGDGKENKEEGGSITSTLTGSKDDGKTNFNPETLETKDLIVTFTKGSGYYAFDTWEEYYKDVSLINNKNIYEHLGSYDVPCKLIPPGKTDKVRYNLQVVKKGGIDKSKLVFKTGAGYILKQDTISHELTLTGGKENDAQDVYALYPDGKGGYQTVGKLKVLSYPERTFSVKLVPIKDPNGQIYTTDEQAVKQILDEIYSPLGITWEVGTEALLEHPSADMTSDGSGLFSQYTSEMKALNSAFQARQKPENNTVYLFVLNQGNIKGLNPAGEMPRGKQFGYLFTGNGRAEDIPWTVAHELGHGRLKLRHTFDGEYGTTAEKEVTQNLMDYHKGTHLAKWQWDEVFAPALLVNPFEGEEEGMAVQSDRIKINLLLDWIKVNIGKNNVNYNKDSYFEHSAITEISLYANDKNGKGKIRLFAELGSNGQVNLSTGSDGIVSGIGINFDLNNKFHTGFYLKIKYNNNSNENIPIKLWCYSYDDFNKLLQYIGLSLTEASKKNILSEYKSCIQKAGDDCNLLDVIYENIPDFVVKELDNETLYKGIELLSSCEISHLVASILIGWGFDTDEEKAILNLLNGIDKQWLYKKINSSPGLIEDILLNRIGVRFEEKFMEVINGVGLANWTQPDYENSIYFLLGAAEIPSLSGEPESINNAQGRMVGCFDNTPKLFKFGTQLQYSYNGVIYTDYGSCTNESETKALYPVLVEAETGESGNLPALVVKFLAKQMVSSNKMDFINLSVGMMMPELFISRANKWKFFGGGSKFSKFEKIDSWIKNLNYSNKSQIESILKNWSDDLLTKLNNIPERNPNFLNQVESNSSILNYFEEGSKIISNKGPNLKAVELDMYALDKARPINKAVIEPGTYSYKINETRKSFHGGANSQKLEINIQSGKIRDTNGNTLTTDNVNGEGLMYVIDSKDNIYIGGRGNEISYPHPTLIGGANPNVKCAGMIKFKDGRVLEINNYSGHFRPSTSAVQEAEVIFKHRLPANSFDSEFIILNK